MDSYKKTKLSVVVPCYNEEKTLKRCIERLLAIEGEDLELEVIIVDDASTDNSFSVAEELARDREQIIVLKHEKNQGKGAALRTGFQKATGNFVAIQDADLEYDPQELKQLIKPLEDDIADVVFGSRYLSGKIHRVLYFWHTLGNKLLTFLSNMFTDLNLTDMETCYKVFRREIIQGIDIKEDRFGFEPEIVAKIAQKKIRIYEIGISYYGRTYEEGKKIGWRDALRALYCIFKYSAHTAPLPIQFLIYIFIGGSSAVFNLIIFSLLVYLTPLSIAPSAVIAYFLAAALNYLLCILILFKHKARWSSRIEVLFYIVVVIFGGIIDVSVTRLFVFMNMHKILAKAIASIVLLVINFWTRRSFVFPEKK